MIFGRLLGRAYVVCLSSVTHVLWLNGTDLFSLLFLSMFYPLFPPRANCPVKKTTLLTVEIAKMESSFDLQGAAKKWTPKIFRHFLR